MNARPSMGTAVQDPIVPIPPKVLTLLANSGLCDQAFELTATSLSGGVSNDVLAITTPRGEVVVKQALAKLRVKLDWQASPQRIVTEAKALRVAGSFQPHHVPRLLAFDASAHIMVIEKAPRHCCEWKTDLLAGKTSYGLARQLGAVLGRWHQATTNDAGLQEDFGDLTSFIELRIDPFYGAIAAQHQDLRSVIDDVVGSMLSRRSCLVHGDFSPKNVLVGAKHPWVIDWEVAHLGDPTFDLAFATAHFACKALHLPHANRRFRRLAAKLLAGYCTEVKTSFSQINDSYLAHQVACLLLARIDGKSPATYLDSAARVQGRRAAIEILNSAKPGLDALWDRL